MTATNLYALKIKILLVTFHFAGDVDRMGRHRTADFNLFMDVRSLIDTPLSEIQRRDGMAAPNSYVFILTAIANTAPKYCTFSC